MTAPLARSRPRRNHVMAGGRQSWAVSAVAAVTAIGVLAGCGGNGPSSRPATSVGPSTVPTALTDLSTIVIGWGQTIAPDQITHPAPKDVSATCTGAGDDLAITIASGPWKIALSHGSAVLKVSNSKDEDLAASLDTTSKVPGTTAAIDWNQPDQVDIAASPYVPASWPSKYGPNQQFFLSTHIDCRAAPTNPPA